MQKVISFSVSDLVIDPDGVADVLTKACSKRRGDYRVRGVCQTADNVFFVLLPVAASEAAESYVIAPLSDVTGDGMTSMLSARWAAGFNALGTVDMGEDSYLMVYARPR